VRDVDKTAIQSCLSLLLLVVGGQSINDISIDRLTAQTNVGVDAVRPRRLILQVLPGGATIGYRSITARLLSL